MGLFYISILLVFIYSMFGILIFIGIYISPIKTSSITKDGPFKNFSIIIPFRNEEENLPKLIDSLRQLNYPPDQFEIIFINDHSEDASYDLIRSAQLTNVTLLNSEKEGKKQALLIGFQQAKFEMIATTDADCILPAEWLLEINKYEDAAMVLGPVQLSPVRSFIQIFQEMEWAALQTISASTANNKIPLMSNGANLSYQKKSFNEVALNIETASGDDMFMLEHFKKQGLSIQFSWKPESIVKTQPAGSITTMLQQKVRWASKSKYYKNYLTTALGILTTCMNILILYHLVVYAIPRGFQGYSIYVVGSKIMIDILIMTPYLILIKKPYLVLLAPFFVLIYPWYFLLVLALSLQGNYHWKGRKYHA